MIAGHSRESDFDSLSDDQIWTDFFQRMPKLASPAEALAFYRCWAPYFEKAVGRIGDYVAPARIAEMVARDVADRDATILDLACGTGPVGMALASRGFRHIDGVDFCPEMLAQAEAKGCYRSLSVADLSQPLAPGTYAALTCAGAFVGRHLGGAAIANMLTALAPGGLFVADVHPDVWDAAGIGAALDSLKAQGVLASVVRECGHYFTPEPGDAPDAFFVSARKT